MALFRTSNPALNRIERENGGVALENSENAATYKGIAKKSIYFVALTFVSALVAFLFGIQLLVSNTALAIGLLFGCLIVAAISGIVASLSPGAAKIAGTIYAVSEGLLVGFISVLYYILSVADGGSGGEVFAALFATIGVAAGMMVLYATGVIRVGSGFKKFMISALVGLLIMGIIMFIISLISPAMSTIFYGNGNFSIFISVIMVLFASLMILFDLNRMTEMVENGVDKKYEWLAAFGLLLTLVWLYMEFLKLFAKISSRIKR